MNIQNPATPPQGAIPGSAPAVVATPPASTPSSTPGQQGNLDGKVTIDLKEYRDLQRAKARTLSFDKRVALGKGATPTTMKNPDGSDADPEIVDRLNQSESLRKEAEKKAMRLEVKGKVRDLLEKPEYAVLPKSTKDLILENPAMLSSAETLDEALLDIEDWVGAKVLELNIPGSGANKPNNNPTGHDTPPVGASGPAPVRGVEPEDLSKLRGTARSQAAIRNAIKGLKK